MSDEDVVEQSVSVSGIAEPMLLEVHEEPSEEFKSYDEIAYEILAGQWGRGKTRIKRLKDAGIDVRRVYEQMDAILHR